MAEGKKSFVLYTDIIHTIDLIDDKKAGILFKHILNYVNDNNPKTSDPIIKILFEPIKQTLKRDLQKWIKDAPARSEKAKKAGLASAKARQLKATKGNSLVENELEPTKSTVSVSVSDSVNGNMPTYKDFKTYALSKKPNINLEALNLKYQSWVEGGWVNGNGKKIKNWKTSLLNTIPYIKEVKNGRMKIQ